MAKDPAVLFYTSDFLTGTMTMTNEQVGKYMRLLCLQHQKGVLTEKDMLNVCKEQDEEIFSKFKKQGKTYVNERMSFEATRRKNYSASRSANRKKGIENKEVALDHMKTYESHMETANETIKDQYGSGKIFKEYRQVVFDHLDPEIKSKLGEFGVTEPMVRNTGMLNRQYIDVVEIIVNVIEDQDWKKLISKNFHLTEKKRGEYLQDFIRAYVTDPTRTYDEAEFKSHFVNWINKKLK